MKLLISFATYPRRGRDTYQLLQKTFHSLIKEDVLLGLEIEFIVVGDDYPNIEELQPIFHDYRVTFYNINENSALRNEPISKEIRWAQAVQRSKIFILEKALEMDYDYILMSADDETYRNRKISTTIASIKEHSLPDFVFSAGTHNKSEQQPTKILPVKPCLYPEPENCISSGCMYNLRNRVFIQDMIDFRKRCWFDVELYIQACKHQNSNYMSAMEQRIKPEDYQLWRYLLPKFENHVYSCVFIPIVLIHHGPERSLFQYI
jgi:hypothetical protein